MHWVSEYTPIYGTTVTSLICRLVALRYWLNIRVHLPDGVEFFARLSERTKCRQRNCETSSCEDNTVCSIL